MHFGLPLSMPVDVQIFTTGIKWRLGIVMEHHSLGMLKMS
jgi:hypothetical protein